MLSIFYKAQGSVIVAQGLWNMMSQIIPWCSQVMRIEREGSFLHIQLSQGLRNSSINQPVRTLIPWESPSSALGTSVWGSLMWRTARGHELERDVNNELMRPPARCVFLCTCMQYLEMRQNNLRRFWGAAGVLLIDGVILCPPKVWLFSIMPFFNNRH